MLMGPVYTLLQVFYAHSDELEDISQHLEKYKRPTVRTEVTVSEVLQIVCRRPLRPSHLC